DDFESLDDLDSYGLDGDPACEDDDIDAIDAEGVDELSADTDDDEGAARAQGEQSKRPMLGISVAGKLDDARIHKFIDAELLGGWTADSVAAFLNGLNPDTPNMISLSSFDPPRRKKTNWCGASGAPGDLDYRDSTGKHCALPKGLREAFQDAMQRARNGDALPFSLPNLWHFTPRGVRVFFLLKQPIETDRAYNEFASWVKVQLVALLQWANIAIASKGSAGFEIDPAANQVAQFMFGPRGIVERTDGPTQ